MSYIVRTGNLAGTPELKEGPQRIYTHARVVVTDSEKDRDTGEYHETATTGYDVTAFGKLAESLVRTAQESGNVRIVFGGDYKVRQFDRQDGGSGIAHQVTADFVAVDLLGQHVTVQR